MNSNSAVPVVSILLTEAQGHLDCAITQMLAVDDQIICDHVKHAAAQLREASRLLSEQRPKAE